MFVCISQLLCGHLYMTEAHILTEHYLSPGTIVISHEKKCFIVNLLPFIPGYFPALMAQTH